MINKYIEFKKKREVGDILSDVFAFIRGNFKQLSLIILKTSSPAIILFIVALAFMTYTYSGFMSDYLNVIQTSNFDSLNMGVMIISLLVLFIASILFYGLVFG